MRLRLFGISVLTAVALSGLARAAGNTFSVTNSGMSAYVIDGANNPSLTLTRGQTYTFTVNNQGHPFWITTARGAAEASSTNAFSQGVTNNGISVGSLTFTVPTSPTNSATLFYQCAFHDPMGGTLNIIPATAATVPALGSIALALCAAALLTASLIALRRRRA